MPHAGIFGRHKRRDNSDSRRWPGRIIGRSLLQNQLPQQTFVRKYPLALAENFICQSWLSFGAVDQRERGVSLGIIFREQANHKLQFLLRLGVSTCGPFEFPQIAMTKEAIGISLEPLTKWFFRFF